MEKEITDELERKLEERIEQVRELYDKYIIFPGSYEEHTNILNDSSEVFTIEIIRDSREKTKIIVHHLHMYDNNLMTEISLLGNALIYTAMNALESNAFVNLKENSNVH